jgi:hypothetical protein
LFSFLFDLVADILHKLLHNAQACGYLSGVETNTNCSRILNQHFADDTLLFLEAATTNI